MNSARSRVAVLGATGFIGTHVTRALRQEHDVIEVPRGQEATVATLAPVCVHLAESNAHTDPSIMQDNVRRAMALRESRLERVIYASSAAVYGDRSAEPHAESDEPRPADLYARGKLAVEVTFAGDPRFTTVRLANVYGPGMSDRNVLSDIVRQLPGNAAEPIRLRDLLPVRDYVHVLDVARAFCLLVRSSLSGVINVGTGIGTSVAELSARAIRIAGQTRSSVDQGTTRPHASHLVVAIARAEQELGWKPEIDLERGLTLLIRGEMS